MVSKLKNYLSSPIASIICFWTAIAGKLVLIRIYLDINSDSLAQCLMAKNLAEGRGLTINLANINNLAETLYVPFTGWPPAYSFLISPLLRILNNNLMLCMYIIHCLVVFFFFVYLRKLLRLIQFPAWLINLFLLFQGFFILTYLSHSTDFMAAALLMAAVYYLVLLATAGTYSSRTTLLFSLFLVAVVYVRYQYIPAATALILALTGFGLLRRMKHWVRSGITALLIFIVATGALLSYQAYYAGSPFFLTPAKTGFYPENLLYTAPFALDIFINLHFYLVQLSLLFEPDFHYWRKVALYVNPVIIFFLLTAYGRFLWATKLKMASPAAAYLVFGGIAALATVFLLVFLSVTRNLYIGAPHFHWTYVMANRYYAFTVLFAQIAIWWGILRSGLNQNLLKTALTWLLIATVFIEITHGVYHAAGKLARPLPPFRKVMHGSPGMTQAISLLQSEQARMPSRKVIVVTFGKTFGFLAGWYGGSAIFTPTLLNDGIPPSIEPVTLLIVLNKKELFLMTPFLENKEVKLSGETEDYCFYSYYVEPTSNNR